MIDVKHKLSDLCQIYPKPNNKIKIKDYCYFKISFIDTNDCEL